MPLAFSSGEGTAIFSKCSGCEAKLKQCKYGKWKIVEGFVIQV